jgi:dTDP-glucose 4,6-dehydratase
MKILITGGAGFIGSNFVHHILENDKKNEIIVLDKLTYAGKKENLEDVKDKITLIKGDITKRNDIEKVEKCDAIINFAAETHVDRSILNAGNFILTDIFGLYNLLEYSRKNDIEKFIQISTDEIYGHIIDGSFKESDKPEPRNPYSASKAGADLLCMSYFETYGLPVSITRSTNNYGPYQHLEKFVPKSIIYSLLNKKIPLYGKGENVRDWIYVKDNCEAIKLVFEKGKNGEIYNIAGKNEIKNIDMLKMILKYTRKAEKLIEFVKDRPGHDIRYSLNINKIKSLGWTPKTSFDEGIKNTIKWYESNQWFWEPILKNETIDFHSKF